MPERLKEGLLPATAATEDPGHELVGLERIFVEHQDRVFRAAYRITGNAQDAEDVLQTIFLRLARRTEGARPVDNLPSYLYRSAVNAAFDLLRARTSAENVGLEKAEGVVPGDPLESPDRAQEAAEIRAWLRRGFARLSPRSAEIFALRYLEDYDNHEIAKMLGVSRVTVAVTLHRTRSRLQKHFRQMRRPTP
ncbi:MAG TPA: sigma-70 family RNA polymerase sigma factor [Vicinamibacteria bacterium]